MSELISGKEAKLAWANGKELEISCPSHNLEWQPLNQNWGLLVFDNPDFLIRIKPRTITLNGIEVPAPFEPEEGEACCFISDESVDGYHTISYNSERYSGAVFGLYRPSDIEQVVAALREVFK